MKILIVEDEKDLLDVMKHSLEKEQYVIESANDYKTASLKICDYDYDCILLDIMLPDGSGLELLKELKMMSKSENVIIISAKNSLDDKIIGLEMGADDYLTKPFHIAELHARVKALLRRKNAEGQNEIVVGNTTLNLTDRQLLVSNIPVHLNRKEYAILSYFMFNKNRTITKSALAEYVWGDNIDQADSYDFIYYQMKNLRKKLQTYEADIEISSIYGVGYKLIEK